MLTLRKENNLYQVEENGQSLGCIEISRNPYHAANCYLKIELNRLEPALGRQLWPKLRVLAGHPLQVMVDASDTAMTHFLSASGFVCKRICYEVNASVDDYIGGTADVKLFRCEAGQADYEACCQMLYRWHLDTHQAVNPWTAGYEDFCAKLPSTAYMPKTGMQSKAPPLWRASRLPMYAAGPCRILPALPSLSFRPCSSSILALLLNATTATQWQCC